jgi:hypothetical protein
MSSTDSEQPAGLDPLERPGMQAQRQNTLSKLLSCWLVGLGLMTVVSRTARPSPSAASPLAASTSRW